MIDVKRTILETIKDKIYNLRFLAKNDTLSFKKILYLIVLDDMYNWASYLNLPQCILSLLKLLRKLFIMDNCEFLTLIVKNNKSYTNVNTPQTIYTWNRVWDLEGVITDMDNVTGEILSKPNPWEPDPSCNTEIIIYPSDKIFANPDGTPHIDINTLTTCEKMNLYFNEKTLLIFYVNSDGEWKPIVLQSAGGVDWENIINKPKLVNGMSSQYADKYIETTLHVGEALTENIVNNDVKLSTDADIKEMFNNE